jgi:hypothetical protein
MQKTGEMFKGWDFTKSAAYDLKDLGRYLVGGNERVEFDAYRAVHAGEYFQLRSRLQTEGVLPHHWEFTFESIDEEAFGFTDKMVTSLLSLYLSYQAIVGGPVNAHRLRHWWNVELNTKDLDVRSELYRAYMMTEQLNDGNSMAAVKEKYEGEYSESGYVPDDHFDAGANEEFAPQPPHAAMPQDVHAAAVAAAAAAAAAIPGGN